MILEEYRSEFTRNDDKMHVHFNNGEEAQNLFLIFRETFDVDPGPYMAKEYMTFPYMYLCTDDSEWSIEGTYLNEVDYVEYNEFLSRYCGVAIDEDDEITDLNAVI